MRLSQYFFRTLKESPGEAEVPSQQLLERAGYIHRLSKGIFCYTPLMQRVLKKLSDLIRTHLDAAGALECALPQLHPKEIWEKSGRWDAYTAENLLYHFKDREGHEMCIGPTCEEICVDLLSAWVHSYKQLPLNLYQISNKFRDEIRPRFGLMRGKEFLMKDGYSFAENEEGMIENYEAMRHAYHSIFESLDLRFSAVEAHGGKIAGNSKSEEFQVLADIGEDAVMTCGDKAYNVEATKSIPPAFAYDQNLKEAEKVSTPGTTTIEALSKHLNIPQELILKTVAYTLIFPREKRLVLIGIRGDREVNTVKVCDFFGALEIELASSEEIEKQLKTSKGFIGPIDCPVPFYGDLTCKPMTNFCVACNEKDVHMININWKRDLPLPELHDFLQAKAGDTNEKDEIFGEQRGIEVGHIFTIGTKYAEKMGAQFQDKEGKLRPFWMGTYGIGIGRLAQACIEQKYDDKGILWPQAIAPFKVMIIPANIKDEESMRVAEELYQLLADYEPLLDDRDARLGFKLKDSDLVGIPYKIIIGKSFKERGELEVESRLGEKSALRLEEMSTWAQKSLGTGE
jgi:prolyl-tRNA synthetase